MKKVFISLCVIALSLACLLILPSRAKAADATENADYCDKSASGEHIYTDDWDETCDACQAPRRVFAVCMADGTLTAAASEEAAIAKHLENPGSYIRLLSDGATFRIPADTAVVIDLNGKTATINGSGTLLGIDSQTNDFQKSPGKAIIGDSVTVEPDVTVPLDATEEEETVYRYIALTEDGVATFHRLDLWLYGISLRTSVCGIFFTARFHCDETLAAATDTYGVACSLVDMPGKDFATDPGNLWTALTPGANFGKETSSESGVVANILQQSSYALNTYRGEKKIYANAYIRMGDTYIVSDTKNIGKTADDPSFEGVGISLWDFLYTMDASWDYMSDGYRANMKQFYATWKDLGLSAWADKFTHLDA